MVQVSPSGGKHEPLSKETYPYASQGKIIIIIFIWREKGEGKFGNNNTVNKLDKICKTITKNQLMMKI